MGKAIYTLGLSKIEVGAIAADGGMGESLEQLGYTYQDTCKMTQEDPETTDHYAEEVDDPVVSISRGGKTNFAFSIMNPSVTVLADLLGGTADESNGKWEAPDKIPVVEKIRILRCSSTSCFAPGFLFAVTMIIYPYKTHISARTHIRSHLK